MISYRTRGLHTLLILSQIGLAICLFSLLVFALHLRGGVDLSRYLLYGIVVAGSLWIESVRRDKVIIRKALFEHSLMQLHGLAMRQTGAVLIGLVVLVTLLKDATLSRIFLASYLTALYGLLLLSNRELPRFLATKVFRGIREQKTLLVGPSAKVAGLRSWLQRKEDFGYRTVGLLCEDESPETAHGFPVLGSPDEIGRVLTEYDISQVIFLGLPIVIQRYTHLMGVCNRQGVRMMILSDLEERLQHRAIHLEDDGLQFISLRQEPLENPFKRATKRLLDLAISLPAIVFVLPLAAAVVWLCQRFQSPGPLFHTQIRAGIQNRRFSIFKFRTMHVGNPDLSRQTARDDDRVYPCARWMRKWSVDELPQFLNVARGDMSVVGPRPHLLEHNQRFSEMLQNYHIRAFIRPGITGLAQVRGLRGEIDSPEAIAARVAADTTYLENWSFFLDVGIVFLTVWQLLCPAKTAY